MSDCPAHDSRCTPERCVEEDLPPRPMTTEAKVEHLTSMVESLARALETQAGNNRKLIIMVADLRDRVRELDHRTLGALQFGGRG